jgi:hypothetical protein
MIYRELFDAAVRMVAESGTDCDVTDYEERAEYLLATVTHQCAPLDRAYRKAMGMETTSATVGVCVPLEDRFPLSDTFAPAVTYYLAAMLVLDENDEMSDTLFDSFSDALSQIRDGLPSVIEGIVNRYEGMI